MMENMDWTHLGEDRDFSERGNEPSACIKSLEFPEWLSDCSILKQDSARCRQLVS
jgi:hypothetical protein